MKRIKVYSISLFLGVFLIPNKHEAQAIVLDENYSDWSSEDLVSSEKGDGQFLLDFESLSIANDDINLYIRIKVDREILIQQSNELTLYLDMDNNPNTGQSFLDIGADLRFNFGQKSGTLYNPQGFTVYHNDIGLITSPTVSSDEFEISILRNFNDFNVSMGDEVKLYISGGSFLADIIPNPNEAQPYFIKENIKPNLGNYKILKTGGEDFRICSYNVLRDNLFQPQTATAFESILKTLNADIICFQEIYDNSANNVITKLESLNVIDTRTDTWYGAKDGNDLITISKYPIKYHQEIDGNSFVVIDKDGQDLIIFNCHLPCCDNDIGRENEIDFLLEFLRNALEGNGPYPVLSQTPYIILGDMNFVGFASQVESLITGDINDNLSFGDDVTMDWDDGVMHDLTPQTTGLPASFTWYNPNGSFSAGRLDYFIYTNSALEVSNSYVLNTESLSDSEIQETGLRRADVTIASDHLPLVADCKMLRSNTEELSQILNIVLYPNPSSGNINISSDYEILSVQIVDQLGKIIYYNRYRNVTAANILDLNVNTGIYTIVIQTTEGFVSYKLVLE